MKDRTEMNKICFTGIAEMNYHNQILIIYKNQNKSIINKYNFSNQSN